MLKMIMSIFRGRTTPTSTSTPNVSSVTSTPVVRSDNDEYEAAKAAWDAATASFEAVERHPGMAREEALANLKEAEYRFIPMKNRREFLAKKAAEEAARVQRLQEALSKAEGRPVFTLEHRTDPGQGHSPGPELEWLWRDAKLRRLIPREAVCLYPPLVGRGYSCRFWYYVP